MFEELEKIKKQPAPFEYYTAGDLWTDEHTSARMLSFHLNNALDVASRNGDFIDRSVEWITTRFKIGKGSKIADFGCGPGLYAARLAKRGAHVTGIDFSERSINYAKGVAEHERLSISYLKQNYLDFDSEDRFDLVIMIMCDFCALSPTQRKNLLNIFHKILKPDGSVLLDVYSISAFEQKEELATCEENLLEGFWSPEKYHSFLNIFKYDEEKVSLDKYTIIEKKRTRIIYNWLQYFTPEDLKKEFMEAGFTVDSFYSDVAGSAYDKKSHEFAVIAVKVSSGNHASATARASSSRAEKFK
ncbi:MAG: class I SAM-dependent methyltransferase [Thermoleophilia bacterium]